jgi:3-hydroxyisobutyrate dehydrogenase/glyoxylate/succinic semialdehyde reductase
MHKENEISRKYGKLGFVGLGLMGSRLARRLHKSGWDITVWNRSPEPAKLLEQEGINSAESLEELVVRSNVILSSLSNDAAVQSVYLDKGGIFSSVSAGTIVLEMSTISPDLSHLLHMKASTLGIGFLDLAVSGSTSAVDAGAITLLAGGDQETFDACVPIYESIAKQWFLIGKGSSGIQMKLVVNLLLGVNMQAIAEAVSLGTHLQIDQDVLLDVLSKTTVIAPALVGKLEKIKHADYSPQFPLRLISKDMDLVLDAANESGAVLPATSAVQSCFSAALTSDGDLDMSSIARFILNGVDESVPASRNR